MKKIAFLFLAVLLFSCDEEVKDGIGVDPELNVEGYTFPKEGGSLTIYSKIGYNFVGYFPLDKVEGNEPVIEYWKNTARLKKADGGWYSVSQNFSIDSLYIQVEENTEGVVRDLPLVIASGNFIVRTKFKQLAD